MHAKLGFGSKHHPHCMRSGAGLPLAALKSAQSSQEQAGGQAALTSAQSSQERAAGQAAGRLIRQLAPAQMQAALSAARALAPGQAAVQVRLVRQTYYIWPQADRPMSL